MAACSELETEGKPLQEKRLLCSKSFDSSTNKEDAFDSRKPCNSEMSKSIVRNENTVDICSLTEEQLHSLLEEATTFNRPKEQDSCILRALRKEIVESDPCGDVNTSDSSSLSVVPASVATVAGHGKRKGGKNVSATSYTAQRKYPQVSDDLLMVNHQTGLQGWTKSDINANTGTRRRWHNKGREEYYGTNVKREQQSQSLQDLPSTRFGDPLDSMRAAGIGRSNRRLHNATRANSFTYTGDGAEWLGIPPLQSQVSTLDGLRTNSCNSKSKTKSKTNSNNPQTVLTIEDETDITRGTISVFAEPVGVGSTGKTHFSLGPKGWSPVVAPTSSPDNLKTSLLTIASCDNCEQSEVSLLSCRPLEDVETLENMKSNINGGLGVIEIKSNEIKPSSPREIEMMELEKGKSQSVDLDCRSTFVYNLEGNCQGGMDCRSDVDSQVNFPLKAGRICAPVNKNDILCTTVQGTATHINGILPMTGRSESVKSIIGNDDTSRKDDLTFYPNVDFNGNSANPLMRVPTTFLTQAGYPFDSHQGINKDLTCSGNSALSSRKAKRSKSNAEKETYSKAEDVAGYCGQLEIDQLLEFINSSGNVKKKPGSKSASVTSAGIVTINSSKNGNSDNEKKKERVASSNRDIAKGKNGFKRKSGGVSSSGSSEEHNGPESENQDARQQSAESDDGEITPIRIASPVSDIVVAQRVEEVNKMVQLHHSVPSAKENTPPSSLLVDNTNFAEDFYNVAEVGQVPVEESEFRVVMNKQRKRKQAKKGEPFRRYSNAGSVQGDRSANTGSSSERDFYIHNQQCHSSGMIIYSGLSHRNQRGKPDPNRRKSTSSMPPSEPSSADNSDLDSVHSLPVVGSIPPITGPHPHTTPSSMSSTPQASYADIARMASSAGNYPSKKMELVSGSPTGASTASPEVTTNPKETPKLDSVEKPNVVNVSTSPMVSIPTGLIKPKTNPIQSTDTSSRDTQNLSPGSSNFLPEVNILNAETDKHREFSRGSSQETVVVSARDNPVEMASQPSVTTVTCNPHNLKTSERISSNSSGQLENPNPPVIQTDTSRVCDVSFGFDLNELMRLSEGGVPVTFEFEQSLSSPPAGVIRSTRPVLRNPKDATDASSTHSSLSDVTIDSVSLKNEASTSEPSPSGADSTIGPSRDGGTLIDASFIVPPESSDNQSSPGENFVVVTGGKRLQFKESLEETQTFNHVQVVNFFGSAWDNIIQDYQKDGAGVSGRLENKRSGRICYYNSSQC